MNPSYCFWSVCTGAYVAMMKRCVRSARHAGVFKQFHILTDQPVEGCECYDAFECDKKDGMFKLHYLKVGMSRLNFDYFVWLDADSVFVRSPIDLLSVLSSSPIHVPLEFNLSALSEDRMWMGTSCFKLRDLFRSAGVANQVYLSRSAFWIVHRDAIDQVYELGFRFLHTAKDSGLQLGVDAALGYAMQMSCANPEAHLISQDSSPWASDDLGHFGENNLPGGELWPWRHPLQEIPTNIRPAIVHLPKAKRGANANQRTTISK